MQMAVALQNHSEIFKFPVFSLSGITFHNFPCAVGTLLDRTSLTTVLKTGTLYHNWYPVIFSVL